MIINSVIKAVFKVTYIPQAYTEADENLLDFFNLKKITFAKNVLIEILKTDYKDPELAEGYFVELKITDPETKKEIKIKAPENEIQNCIDSKKVQIENLNCVDGISLFPNYECGSLELIID